MCIKIRNILVIAEAKQMLQWLRAIRKEKGLSQSRVAEAAQISQQYYNMIELGQRGNPLNVNVAKRIAAVLDFEWTRFYQEDQKGA
jgi:putative transcriptional regulator